MPVVTYEHPDQDRRLPGDTEFGHDAWNEYELTEPDLATPVPQSGEVDMHEATVAAQREAVIDAMERAANDGITVTRKREVTQRELDGSGHLEADDTIQTRQASEVVDAIERDSAQMPHDTHIDLR